MAASLFDVVRRHASSAGGTLAAVDGIAAAAAGALGDPAAGSRPVPARLTYAELHDAAERLAAALAPVLAAAPAAAGASAQGCCAREPALGTWMRRGSAWYCVFLAAARLQAPLAALSADLPNREAERDRNAEILLAQRPALVVVDHSEATSLLAHPAVKAAAAATTFVQFAELWARAWEPSLQPVQQGAASPDSVLCYCYTGGTTKASRCAKVTHRMALQEVATYHQVVKLGPEDRVLQQHSVYWAASAYGELDVALAFGCAVVFCEAWDTEAVAASVRAHGATCAGLVPSILAALAPGDVPSLRAIFTWGEALQPSVAREWARRTQLIDLLISTECWLSLYADWSSSAGDGVGAADASPAFRVLPGARVRLRPLADGGDAVRSGAGELLVAGPMVSPGYTDPALSAEAFEVDAEGTRWYCTKDCLLRRADGGLVFAGRADDLVKVGGAWVDIREVEGKLTSTAGAAEVSVGGRAAFVAVGQLRDGAVARLRAALPPGFALLLVPALPRRVGTDKIDRRRLQELLHVGGGDQMDAKESKVCREEFASLLRWYWPLLCLALSSLLQVALRAAVRLLAAEAGAADAACGATGPLSAAADAADATCESPGTAPLAAEAWGGAATGAAAAACGLVALCVEALWELAWRLIALVYILLLYWSIPPKYLRWSHHFPLGAYGLVVAACCLLPAPFACAAAAAPGAALALRRGRLLAWPLVCLVGFPTWARDAGWWMRGLGPLGVLRWYMVKPAYKLSRCWRWWHKEGGWHLRQKLGLARECEWCEARVPSAAGRIERSVGDKWYCNDCWAHYHNHKECSKCKDWNVHVAADLVTGELLCRTCRSAPPGASAPANGETATGAGARSGGAGGGGGGEGNWGGRGGGGGVSRRVIKLKPTEGVVRMDGVEALPTCRQQTRSPPTSPCGRPAKRPRLEGQQQQQLLHVENGTPNGSGACDVTPSSAKSREWRVIEEATGTVFDSLSGSLQSLDSLRHTKMTGALRREVGKHVSRDVLKRSASLGDLLEELRRLPEEGHTPASSSGSASPDRAGREHPVWGMMWNSKCQWMFRRSRPLSEAVLRVALEQLIDRHEPLRAELRDPYRLFNATQTALSALELWRRHGTFSADGRVGAALAAATRWSFRHSWPRVGARPPLGGRGGNLVPLKVLERCATEEEAERKIWPRAADFAPPFKARLVAWGKDAEEGALVHLAVTHMLSDGFSVVPLLEDLARLVARIEAGAALCAQPLPPVPSPFAVLEARLLETIAGDAPGTRGGITREPIAGKRWHEAACVFASIPAEVVTAVHRAAQRLAVPDDVLMLAAMGIALSWLEAQELQPLAVIVPQRDGPGENDVVGLFADVRHLTLCTGGLSFAGVALHLHHIIQERLWCAPGLATQYDLAIVNFEWTDFAERHGFVQRMNLGERGECSLHPLRIAVDQPDRETWRLRVAFDKQRFGARRRERFFEHLESALRGLLDRPLELVWPAWIGSSWVPGAGSAAAA